MNVFKIQNDLSNRALPSKLKLPNVLNANTMLETSCVSCPSPCEDNDVTDEPADGGTRWRGIPGWRNGLCIRTCDSILSKPAKNVIEKTKQWRVT
jgi:hypothetical protein